MGSKKEETTNEKTVEPETYDVDSLFKQYESIFKSKSNDIVFSIIGIDEEKKDLIFIYKCTDFDNSSLTYEKLILSAKSPKKTSYFKIDDKNYMLERLLNNNFILVLKPSTFSISEKFTYGKLIEEIRVIYKKINK